MNRECPVLHSDAALTPWTKVHHRIQSPNELAMARKHDNSAAQARIN